MIKEVFLYYCAAVVGAAIGYLTACIMHMAKDEQ